MEAHVCTLHDAAKGTVYHKKYYMYLTFNKMFKQVCVLLCLVIGSLVLQKLNLNAYVEVSLTLPYLFVVLGRVCSFNTINSLFLLVIVVSMYVSM